MDHQSLLAAATLIGPNTETTLYNLYQRLLPLFTLTTDSLQITSPPEAVAEACQDIFMALHLIAPSPLPPQLLDDLLRLDESMNESNGQENGRNRKKESA